MTGLTCSVAASGAVVRRNGLANVTPVTTHLTAFRLWVSFGANRLNQTRPQVRHSRQSVYGDFWPIDRQRQLRVARCWHGRSFAF